MPVPTRPTTGGPVESAWGQEVHDAAFAAHGGRWHSQSTAENATSTGEISLVADADPGGWLVGGAGQSKLYCPADGGGLYLAHAVVIPTTGEAATLRWTISKNGPAYAGSAFTMASSNTSSLFDTLTTLLELVPGDYTSIYFSGIGAPSVARFSVPVFQLTRLAQLPAGMP